MARRAKEFAALDKAFENLLARSGEMKNADVTRAMRHLADREANL